MSNLRELLRKRLLKTGVRHHQQLFEKQLAEDSLRESLSECSSALVEAAQLLNRSSIELPETIVNGVRKFSIYSLNSPNIILNDHKNLKSDVQTKEV